MLEEVSTGRYFAAVFLDGERGTPFLSVPESVWIPTCVGRVSGKYNTGSKLHCSRSAVGDLVSKPQPPLCSVFPGEKRNLESERKQGRGRRRAGDTHV